MPSAQCSQPHFFAVHWSRFADDGFGNRLVPNKPPRQQFMFENLH